MKQAAKELGIDPKSVNEEDLEKIRKAVGLCCFEKQPEVLGFINRLLGKQVKS